MNNANQNQVKATTDNQGCVTFNEKASQSINASGRNLSRNLPEPDTRDLVIHGREFSISSNGEIWRKEFMDCRGTIHRSKELTSNPNGRGYYYFGFWANKKLLKIQTHRAVAMVFLDDYSEILDVDHVSGDKSDNSASNLRMLSRAQNCRAHRSVNKNKSSCYRGVCRAQKGKAWVSGIYVDGKRRHLGRYSLELDAAKAYNAAAISNGYAKEALNVIEGGE